MGIGLLKSVFANVVLMLQLCLFILSNITMMMMMMIADITSPPPVPFLALPSKSLIPWTPWVQSLETYLNVAHKKTLLQHYLGAEGHRVFRTLAILTIATPW